MSHQVHYLIREPNGEPGFIYPQETEINNYYGFGGFYLLGREGELPLDEYSFKAVHGHEIIETRAIRYRDTKRFYQVEVTGVGKFIFLAQPIPKKIPYLGTMQSISGLLALSRMRSWKPDALNRACIQNDFYFVGNSSINTQEAQ